MQPPQVFLADAAYLALVAEAREYADRETGGIFLGTIQDERWYVLEVIDPGYGRIVRKTAYFEYDREYVTHLANVRSRLYRNGLGLLGLWHRHPGSFDRFSRTDDGTNRIFAEGRPEGALSALVNFDPDFLYTPEATTSLKPTISR